MKKFNEKGKTNYFIKKNNIYNRTIFENISFKYLKFIGKNRSIGSLLFRVEKRDKIFKIINYTNESTQYEYIDRYKVDSLTESTIKLLLKKTDLL